jgi:hypothetical protein
VPATLAPSPGTRVALAVTWLTPEQERVMHATEAVGVIYDFVRLTGVVARFEDGRALDRLYAYVNRRGALLDDATPIALAAVPAKARVWPALAEAEVLDLIRHRLAPERALDDFIRENVLNGAARRARNRRLAAFGQAPQADWRSAAL